MPRPGTFRQLLDAPYIGNISAAQVTRVQLWISEGVGSQGKTSQRTYPNQNLEKWEWAVRAFCRQEAVWERRGTLHKQWHGWYSAGESEVLPACLLPRQPKGPAAIRWTLLLCCVISTWAPLLFCYFSLSPFISSHFSWCFCSVMATCRQQNYNAYVLFITIQH